MSKTVIFLCVMVVASLDASGNDQFEVEDQIESALASQLDSLTENYTSMMQAYENMEKKYSSIPPNITMYIYDVVQKALDIVHDVRVNTSFKCDIEKHLGGYDCSQAIYEVADKGLESVFSVSRCLEAVLNNLFENENILEADKLYSSAVVYISILQNRPLCSSRYSDTTQLEFITSCNNRTLGQLRREIRDKYEPARAKMEEVEKMLPSFLNDAPDCEKHWNETAYQSEMEEAARKAKTCYELCQLEEQSQTARGKM